MRMISRVALGLVLAAALPVGAAAGTDFVFGELSIGATDHVTVYVSDAGALGGAAQSVNALTDERLEAAMADAGYEADFGATRTFYGLSPFRSVTVIGTGEESLSARQLHDLGGYTAKASDNDTSLTVLVDGLNTSAPDAAAHMAMGYKLGAYRFDKYKKDARDPDRTVSFLTFNASGAERLYRGDLEHLAVGVNFARDMGTEPGKSMYPERFAAKVRELFAGVDGVTIEVMGVDEMRGYNMGALLGVGQGSIHDPRLVIVRYDGGAGGDVPVALVGKGITFDTGGISLKSNTGMWAMKSDLSGAAAVAGTLYAAAQRGEDINLVGVMAMAENMPAEDAIRPGDVLETMSGTSIEIISTDAEGRLVLSDGVRYAQDAFAPELLLNIATLTGSAGRALGDDYAAVITRDWDLSEEMVEIGKVSGEDVWPLPLNANHYKAIKSDIADIKNTGGSPGASIGAAVIGTFVDADQDWVHLDIAGVDWLDSGTPTSPKGHAGWGVRFMDAVVRDRAGD